MGLRGVCAHGAAVPLTLELRGGAADFEGEVRLILNGGVEGNGPPLLKATQPLLLAAQSTRRFTWHWLPPGGAQSMQNNHLADLAFAQGRVELWREGKLIQTQQDMALQVNCAYLRGQHLVIGFARHEGWLKGLEKLTFAGHKSPPSGGEIRVVELSVDEIPPAAVLAAARLVVVADAPEGGFSRSQLDNLWAYARQGGQLVFSAPLAKGLSQPAMLGFEQAAWSEEAGNPAQVSETRAKSSEPDPTQPLTVVGLRGNNIQTLAYSHRAPLLSFQKTGLGEVYWLGVDPSRPPWLGSRSLNGVWRHLLAPVPRLRLALTRLPEGFMPEDTSLFSLFPWLPFFLMCFTFMLGPGQWWLLKQWQGNTLAWITLPATCVLFALSAGFLWRIWPGDEPLFQGETLIMGSQDNPRDATLQFRGWGLNPSTGPFAIPLSSRATVRLNPVDRDRPLSMEGQRLTLMPRHGQAGVVWEETTTAPFDLTWTQKDGALLLHVKNKLPIDINVLSLISPLGEDQNPAPSPFLGIGQTVTFNLSTVLSQSQNPLLSSSMLLSKWATPWTHPGIWASSHLDSHHVLLSGVSTTLFLPKPLEDEKSRQKGQSRVMWLVALPPAHPLLTQPFRRLAQSENNDLFPIEPFDPEASSNLSIVESPPVQSWNQPNPLNQSHWQHLWTGVKPQGASFFLAECEAPRATVQVPSGGGTTGNETCGLNNNQAAPAGSASLLYNPLSDTLQDPCPDGQLPPELPYFFQDQQSFVSHPFLNDARTTY